VDQAPTGETGNERLDRCPIRAEGALSLISVGFGAKVMIGSRLKFAIQSLQEKLWIKPLGYALLALAIVYLAHFADRLSLDSLVPDIRPETIEKLLTVLSSSMLAVATFAVASMVSAYASAGSNATPRAFSLLVADGQSQTALSSFIGAFIFSIVGLIALKVGFFGTAGRFTLFLATMVVFAWVVLTFVRWVDNIARLGRLGNTVEKVEQATREAFGEWPVHAPLGAIPITAELQKPRLIHSDRVGFIQHIAMEDLEEWARQNDAFIEVCSYPGSFVGPDRPLASVYLTKNDELPDVAKALEAFLIADCRSFPSDPRFGLITMSEIGSRALSPGINDPGTAIDIAVRMARLIREWDTREPGKEPVERFERVLVSGLDPADIVEDAFGAISKDGVGSVEFGIWLQKSLAILTKNTSENLSGAARKQAELALERARMKLDFEHDVERLEKAHRGAFWQD
jgi:uncharacterized membrane protein